jgi:hypothetical protein
MTLTAIKEARVAGTAERKYVLEPAEVMAFCPACKAFQTVWLRGDRLMSTRRFTQQGDQIYHSCGSEQPCLLYYTW